MFRNKLVLLSIFIPLLVSAVFSVMIIANEPRLVFDLSIEGFSNFHKWFAVPLYTAALSFPLLAISISNYRARQTDHQIKLSKEQNVFVNYYKHHEEFEKRLEKLERRFEIEFKDKSGLYKLFFSENGPYHIDVKSKSDFAVKLSDDFRKAVFVLNDYSIDFIKAKDITFRQKCDVALFVLPLVDNFRYHLRYEKNNAVLAKFIPVRNKEAALLSLKDDEDYIEINIIDEILYDLFSFSFIDYERVVAEENRPGMELLNKSVQILFACRDPGRIKGSKHWEPKLNNQRDNRPDVVSYSEFAASAEK